MAIPWLKDSPSQPPRSTAVEAVGIIRGNTTFPAEWAGALPGQAGPGTIRFRVPDIPALSTLPITVRVRGGGNAASLPVTQVNADVTDTP